MKLLSSWKLSVVLMATAGAYYAFLAIFATMSPPVIVGNIAVMIPFWAVYVLVLLNTVVCLWRRLPEIVREIGSTPLADRARPRWHHRLDDDATREQVDETLRSMGYSGRATATSGIVGVRGRWGALGTLLFHGSFLLLATGFFLTFAFRGESSTIVAVGQQLSHDGTAIRVDSIHPEFWRDQLLFTTLTAEISVDGAEAQTIAINRPLWLGFGRFLRLTNFGFAPAYELLDDRGRLLDSAVVNLGVFPPGVRDQFRIPNVPHRIYVQIYPDAGMRGDAVESRSLNLRDPVIAARVTRGKLIVAEGLLRPGEALRFEGFQLRFPEIRYHGEFSTLIDPGAPFLLVGFLIGFVGLLIRAGGRRAEIAWIPADGDRGGELRGFGNATAPPEAAETPAERHGRWLIPGTVLTLLVVGLWIARWIAAGHIPLFGTYESALSLGAAVMVTSWLWEYRGRFRSGAGPVCAVLVAVVLAHGYTFDRNIYALTISERSWVVDVHAVLAWIAFGLLATNAGLSLMRVIARDPLPRAQDKYIERTLELGFVLHSAMLFTGSIYKFLLFGRSWSFDPIETLGFAAWVAYGTLVHMVRFARWDGARLAKWCLFLFIVLLVSYRVIVYYPAWSTYHIFDMDLRMHLV